MTATTRFLSYLTTFLMMSLFAACGGGGGSVGTSSGSTPQVTSPPSLFTTAPGTLTVGVGSAQEFTIGGGTSPYTAVSNNAAVAIAGVKDARLTLGGGTNGTAEITIRDAGGASVIVSMIVSSGPVRPLYTTATSSVTIAPGLSGVQTYQVGGGVSPYTATSSNTSVASLVLTGDNLKVTGLTAGSTNILIMDSLGATVSIAVTVPTVSNLALFTTAPPSVTVAIGASPAYSVGGGTAPYSATSSATTVAAITLAGNNMTVTGVSVGSASIVVRDSAGASVTVVVTVPTSATVALFTTAPPNVTVAIGANPAYSVGGGTSPYTATSSSTSVATATLSDNSLTITGVSAGSASIVVRDSAGATATVAVAVSSAATVDLFTTAPSAITVAIGASPAYNVGGGTAPYTATTDNVNVATASLAGNSLTITGRAVGEANISLRDSTGSRVAVKVTVGTTVLAVTPNGATGIINDVIVATITGGTPPYRSSVGNVLVAAVSINGNELRTTLLQVGQTIVTVLDANNQPTAYSLISNAATPEIRLSPNAVKVSENGNEPIFFTVYGSAPGALNVFSSDVTRLNATIVGDRVTVITGSNGNRCVPGGDIPVTITVVDTTRATGTAIVTIEENQSACP